MRLYAGSEGRFYTEYELSRNIETGLWESHMWDTEAGWEVVETVDKHILWLLPIEEADLPDGFELRTEDDCPTVVETDTA